MLPTFAARVYEEFARAQMLRYRVEVAHPRPAKLADSCSVQPYQAKWASHGEGAKDRPGDRPNEADVIDIIEIWWA
jgi:hypothetical protein